jgi:virginiamycin B lyase
MAVIFGAVAPGGAAERKGRVTEFSAGVICGLFGLTVGPDGNLWCTEYGDEDVGGGIGRVAPKGKVTEFSAGVTPGAQPGGIAAGPDGNLWFTVDASAIGRITPAGVITEFSAGVTSPPQGLTAGPDGNLWSKNPVKNHPDTGRTSRHQPGPKPQVTALRSTRRTPLT